MAKPKACQTTIFEILSHRSFRRSILKELVFSFSLSDKNSLFDVIAITNTGLCFNGIVVSISCGPGCRAMWGSEEAPKQDRQIVVVVAAKTSEIGRTQIWKSKA